MTKEEAIAWLKLERKARSEISKGKGILPALDLAIESLSADNDNVNTVSTSEIDKAVEDYLGSEIEIDDLL